MIEDLLESTGTSIREEIALLTGPPHSEITDRHNRIMRRRRAIALVGASVLIGLAGITYAQRNGTEARVTTQPLPTAQDVLAQEPTGETQAPAAPLASGTSAPESTPSSTLVPRPDPSRTLLDQPIGRERARYVRSWTRTESDNGTTVILTEQWSTPDGSALVASALLSDPGQGLTNSEQAVTAWRQVENIPTVADWFGGGPGDPSRGYPERDLPSDTDALRSRFANPPPGGQSPPVFISVSSAGGDGSYLPTEADTVRELVRLLPTIMEPAHRTAAFNVAQQIAGARLDTEAEDLLGRPSLAVTIPLTLTDPTDGTTLGLLETTFWFDPDSHAPQQIEWRLVNGVFHYKRTTRFIDTTVIIAAGEVAEFPEPDPGIQDTTPSTSINTTIQPEPID